MQINAGTYYSIYLQSQRSVTRLVRESVEYYFTEGPGYNTPCPQCLNRTNSCPDLREGLSERPLGPNVRNSVLSSLHNKEIQTLLTNLQIVDKSAQYSAPSEASDTDYISEEESLPEETQCPQHDT